MDQLKRRFYILGLSLLVLIVALAGLLGILDSLPEPGPSTTSSDNGEPPIVSQPPGNSGGPQETPVPPSANGTTPGIAPGFTLSLPDSFNLDSITGINPGFSLEAPPPPHIPVFEVSGAENTAYLKSITSSYFDGREWQPIDESAYIEYNGESLLPPDLDPDQIVIDEITVAEALDIIHGRTAIPTSLYPVSVNSSTPLRYFPDDMTFLSEEGFPEEYTFQTMHYIFERRALANAELDSLEDYLQLPDNITPRTYELAENITGGITSSFLMAKAIEDYLKTNYIYDFAFENAPEGQEPNDWFLFEEKRGVCTNFNSAFVILCRAAGIPARLAGGFLIEPREEEQAVYTDQAHAWAEVKFKDLGWYTFDATGSPASLMPTETEITSVSPLTQKGHEFTVAGTVWTDAATPAEGVLVEILINDTKDAEGAVLIGKGIVTEGRFKIQAIIPGETEVGEYHVLAHSLGSVLYRESWSDPVIKVVSGVSIDLQFPPRIKTGETLTLTGSLAEEFGQALAGHRLEIYLNGELIATPVTDSAGGFTWEGECNEPGDYTLKVSYPGTEYYLASSREAEFRVLAPAVIELKADGGVIDSPVFISGRLVEEISDHPLPERALAVSIDGVMQDATLITDNEGRFEFEHIFHESGGHRVEVKFAGDADYYETSAAADIEITASAAFSPWKIIIIALALAAAAVGGWFLYRRLKNVPARPEVAEIKASADNPIIAATAWKSSEPGAVLTIEFPQIIDPFPDVWGTGDELTIVLRMTDETGAGTDIPIDFSINHKAIAHPSTGKDGRAEIHHVFPSKGLYELAAENEDTDLKKASAGRTIRIVDYREEIVDLFDKLVEGFRKAGISIPEEATPRKIQYLVLNAKRGIPEKALDDAVNCFEETDYSLHPITRRHYEIMYLAQKEIKEHGIEPAAAD